MCLFAYLEELLVPDTAVEDLFDEDFLVGVLILEESEGDWGVGCCLQ